MKSRKTRMFTALGLVAISGFSLVAVSFVEAQTKDIKLDPTNARQTIPTIQFRSDIKDGSKYVELTNVRDLLRINTKESNFVLKKGSSDASGRGATILGGNNNHVDNGNYSTIIAGSDNQVNNSSYATIGGGEKNIVQGGYGTVAGGQENTAKSYSTVVGGSKNKAAGDYAVALGNNSEANSDYSVAMGKNAKVSAPNSFLWSDNGATLGSSYSNVFAVVGDNGMVVNKDKAHRFAKLTIGGSIIINSRASDASTCNSTTVGVVKVTGGSHGQACFCSCNGSKRNSLYGGGDCSSKCDTSITPVCDDILIKDCSSSPYSYSGHCKIGEVAEGDGAYMVDKDGKIHWTCQTNDGKTASCVSNVTSTIGGTDGVCEEPNPEGNCSGGYDEDKAEFVAGSDEGFEGIVNATLYNRLSDVPSGTKCAWYCKDGFYKKGDICAPMEGCDEYEEGERHVPYLAHGETRTITNNAGTCTRTATCDNGTPALGEPTCYSCQGSAPSNATMVAGSDQGLSSNVDRTLYANSTAAAGKKCAYLCDLSSHYYYKNGSCSFKIDWCNNDVVNGCVSPSSATNQNSSDPSKYTWDCAIDGTTMEMGCSKCKDGYTDKGNGVCEREAITINICPKVTYGDCTASALKNCQRGSSLSNLSFEADQLLPKNIDIQVDLNYHFQDPGLGVTPEDGCSYLNEEVNPVYTIANGYKASDNGGDIFNRYNTMCVSSYGYKKYFDRSFDYNFKDTSTKTYSFTLDGQEYILNLNGICGTTTGTITPEEAPKCGSANNTNRSSAPSTQAEKCENGSPSTISPTSDGWTWTCSKDGVTTNPPCIAYKEPKCGTSNGKTVSSMPTGTAACNPGNRATPITGDTQFTWNCGLGPKTVPCSANREQSYPQCGSAHQTNTLNKPTQGLCSGGTASEVVEGVWSDLSETVGGWRGDAPIWKWSCSNGTQTDDGCYAVIPYAEIGCEGVNGSAVDFGTETFGSTSSPDFKGIDFSFYVRYDCVDGSHIGESGEEVVNGYYDGTNNGGIWQGTAGKCGWINATRVNYVEIRSVYTREMNGFRLLPGDSCVNTVRDNGCAAGWYGDYYISGYVSNGVTVNVTRREGDLTCSVKMKCVYGNFQQQGAESCQGKCQGSHPNGVTLSTVVPTNNTTNWFCATDTTQACSYTCPTGKQCNASNTDCIGYECQGSAPSNATLVAGSDQNLSSNVDRKLYADATAAAGKKCAYLCNSTHEYKNGVCEPKTYSCQGSAPSNATLVAGSDQGLSSNVDRTLYANSTAAAGKKCAYLCDLSRSYYYKNGSCSFKIDWCNNDVVNGCVSPSSATNPDSSNASKSTWDCAIDGTTMELGCYKCKDGYTDKGNGVCASESHYYISLGLRKHTTERATEIIIYVKDGSGTSTRIPDDKLNIAYHMRSSNGSDFSYWENAGNKSDGSVFDGVPDLLGYKLDEIEFYSDDNELVEEMDDSGLTAKIGNNTYHIIGFVGEAGQCGKATDQDSITKPTSQLCNKGLESDVKAILKNNKFYWSWTCYGTSDASCEKGIPTAEFNRCNPTTSSMTVKYTLYNNDFDGSMNFDSNGVVIGDSRVEATLGSSNPQTINSIAITEINSIKYGTNLLPGREGAEVYIKNNYALKGGNVDSSLCSSPSITCTYNGDTYNVGDTITTYNTETAATCTAITSKCLSSGLWDKTPGNYTSCQTVSCMDNSRWVKDSMTCTQNSYNVCNLGLSSSWHAPAINYPCANTNANATCCYGGNYWHCECQLNKCPARGACPITNPGDQCKKYSMASPVCPTTCSLTTYTCKSDGTWDMDPVGSAAFCTPQAVPSTCSKSEYPLEGTYGVNNVASFNECKGGYTVSTTLLGSQCNPISRYSIKQCKPGFTKSSDGKRCEGTYYIEVRFPSSNGNPASNNTRNTLQPRSLLIYVVTPSGEIISGPDDGGKIKLEFDNPDERVSFGFQAGSEYSSCRIDGNDIPVYRMNLSWVPTGLLFEESGWTQLSYGGNKYIIRKCNDPESMYNETYECGSRYAYHTWAHDVCGL